MKLISLLFTSLVIFSCNEIKKTGDDASAPSGYIQDTAWMHAASPFVISQPTGIGVDGQGHLFVFQRTGRRWTQPFPDSTISKNTILELDGETGKLINAWGAHTFIMPHGLTVDKDNNVWVTDVGLHQVLKFSHDGNLLMRLGTAKMPGNDSSHFNLPTDIAVGEDGSVYISDGYGNSRLAKFDASGKFVRAWGTFGKQPGAFIIPHGIAIDGKGIIYVADRQNNRVQLFDTSGNFMRVLQNNEAVEQLPAVALDTDGSLYAIDYDSRKKADSTANGSTFFRFDDSQVASSHFGATGDSTRTTCWFHDIEIDSKGNIYTADITGLRVMKFKPAQKSK